MIGIYLITNNRNNLKYVGQTTDIKKRIKEHFSGSFAGRTLIDSAIAAEPDNFSWSVLKECNKEDLDYYEYYYIGMLDSMNHGYNRTFGGHNISEQARLCGERHPRTYYTDQEILNIRQEYMSSSIEDLYEKYKKGQSFYTFKNQVLNSYSNLPKYNKVQKKWIYPSDWQGEKFLTLDTFSNSQIPAEAIMKIRRLSKTLTVDKIIEQQGLAPFKSYRHVRDTINGKLYTWLPYFSSQTQHWVYPEDWAGEKEEEINETDWPAIFYKKETSRGQKLSNYQVIQIRYLASLKYPIPKIYQLLQLENICSKDALNLVIKNKTYLSLPYVLKDEWVFPTSFTQIQKERFPLILDSIRSELMIDGVDD